MSKKIDKKIFDKIVKVFSREIMAIADELEIEPDEITLPMFRKYADVGLTSAELKKVGGFNALKKIMFKSDNDNIVARYGTRAMNRHINALEKAFGEEGFFEQELTQTILTALENQKLYIHAPIKADKKTERIQRTIVAQLSDTHFGANIDLKEMHGINEFNWTIAARRLAYYMQQIANYKPDRRSESALHLQLNGDILAGLIHNQEWFVDLLTTQFTGALYLLVQAISYVARHFTRVTVVCTPGNHGRNIGKRDNGRATTQKWDSYENMLYEALRSVFSAHNNVNFVIPKAPYVISKIHGHYILQTHGDTVINVGNPGNTIRMKTISDQINQMNSSPAIAKGKTISAVSVGHIHTPTLQFLANGCALVINGCLSGTDPFAQSIGIFSNNPAQVLFESTDKYAVGDIRIIRLEAAGKMAELDKIIKPYEISK